MTDQLTADLIREECAKICESTLVRSRAEYTEEVIRAISVCAAAIRSTITDPAALEQTTRDAQRYAARRKEVYLLRMRMQISGTRLTEDEFNAEYDAGCDKNLAGYVTDHRGVWVKDAALANETTATQASEWVNNAVKDTVLYDSHDPVLASAAATDEHTRTVLGLFLAECSIAFGHWERQWFDRCGPQEDDKPEREPTSMLRCVDTFGENITLLLNDHDEAVRLEGMEWCLAAINKEIKNQKGKCCDHCGCVAIVSSTAVICAEIERKKK